MSSCLSLLFSLLLVLLRSKESVYVMLGSYIVLHLLFCLAIFCIRRLLFHQHFRIFCIQLLNLRNLFIRKITESILCSFMNIFSFFNTKSIFLSHLFDPYVSFYYLSTMKASPNIRL